MKRKRGHILNATDKEVIHLFTDLGMPKNLARTLIYISQVDDCRSREIEKGTDLLQPQVSLAIQELIDKGWVTKHGIKKKKGKGRPVHFYKLNAPLEEILGFFEEEKHKEIKITKRTLSELETLLTSNYK